jgi:hypothetical protein
VEQLHSDKPSLVISQEAHSLVMNNVTGHGNSSSSLPGPSGPSYNPTHGNECKGTFNSVGSRFTCDNDIGVDPRLQILGDSEYLVEGLLAKMKGLDLLVRWNCQVFE